MKLCPHCRTEIAAASRDPFSCPGCGRRLVAEEATRWTSIARLTNLAETGYFADLIQAEEVPTNIVQHSEFDAVDGAWRTIYLLQVPEDEAAAAAESLKRELALAEEEAGRSWPRDDAGAERRAAGGSWKPVVLILVAGGLAFYAGRFGVDRRPPPARPAQDELDRALGDLPPGVSFRSEDGGVRRRLTFDRDSRAVFLEEDFDQDGRWDRLRMYRQGELVTDTAP
jgi:hypothetical protein